MRSETDYSERMESGPDDDPKEQDRRTWMGLVAAVVLVLLGAWGMVKFKQSNDMFNCIAAGHHNCTPAVDLHAPR